MSESTIIDQLVVKLGLDPKDFKKGATEVKKSFRELQAENKQAAGGMNAGLDAVIGKYFKLAAVIAGVKKVVGYTSDLSVSLRQLGLDSRNLNIAANDLKAFQNVEEMMGGKSDNLTKSIEQLNKSIYDLTYNGQVNDQIVTLARLGVQFQDTAGEARDFGDIVLDTQAKIQQLQKQGMSRTNAYNMLQQAGFSGGLIQAMLDNQVRPEYSKQMQRGDLAWEAVPAATAWERSAKNREQAVESVAMRALPAAAEKGTALNDKIAQGADYVATAGVDQAAKDFTDALGKAGDAVEDFTNRIGRWFVDMAAKSSDAATGIPLGARNNNPLNLREAGGSRFRTFTSMEDGIVAAYDQLALYRSGKSKAARGRKINTLNDIAALWAPASDGNDPETYARQVGAWTGIDPAAQLKDSDIASVIAGMSRKEIGAKYAPDAGDVATVLQAAQTGQDYHGIVGQTTIDIGEININTQATDASGIAKDIKGALQRQTMGAHAERGQQ